MPDALEVAAAQDRTFAKIRQTGWPPARRRSIDQGLVRHCRMHSTAGAEVAFANDRPPHDATFVTRLREAGAIILAKANVAAGYQPRSPFGGVVCNPYDTERSPGVSSAGSGVRYRPIS